jgi:hypothetical protein
MIKMYLEQIETIAKNTSKKVIYFSDEKSDFIYNGETLIKSMTTSNGSYRVYDYYTSPKTKDHKAIPKSLKKLVDELEFVRDSLVERVHVRVDWA